MPINTAKKKIPLHRIAAASIFFDGRIVCVSPAINAVLQMIEPNAFPAAIAADPSNAAVVDTRISGRVVPRPVSYTHLDVYKRQCFALS